ncbi:MAG: hypothetical protein KDB99_16135 [Chitinophagaceae bacterium]|nr:hypothetical protein [Chitinophagaceae bacterium]
MTTYLIKKLDGKTYHFRVTVAKNGYEVVEGQFYKWISKTFYGTGKHINNATLIDQQKVDFEAEKLINEKIKDGYIKQRFIETKENTYDVYDKAKYHFDGEFPEELEEFQGYIHTGMFINWLIDNDLMDKIFFEDCIDEINSVKQRKMTGSQFYESQMDGAFLIEEVSELGNRFALEYFDFDTGQYLSDYEATLSNGLPTMYHVADTWDNYRKLRAVIDKRFAHWKNQKIKKPFWKIW